MTEFYNNCALPDTSMTFSAFVPQTFLIMKSMQANAIFSIFKMATMIFKMAVKLIIVKQIKQACVFYLNKSKNLFYVSY